MKGVFDDLTGKVFTWLIVIEFEGRSEKYHAKWLCRCKCGKEKVVYALSLKSGATKSCGCYNRNNTSERLFVHGEGGKNRSREYNSWISAKGRCFNKKDQKYHRYGGRGITMCQEWRMSYKAFLENLGRCPEGLMLERINNEGHYEPGNCRWATPKEEANNRSTNLDYKERYGLK